jgi:hypothetical protein
VGRINLRSGTRDKRVRDRILTTLDALYERGRLDLLENLRDGVISPLELYNSHQSGETNTLRSAAEIKPLVPHIFDWLDDAELAETTRRGYKDRFTQLVKLGGESLKVADLPDVLERQRTKQKALGQHRSWNQCRSACQSYLRSTLGRSNPLYIAVSNLEPFEGKPKRKGNPLSVVDALAIRDAMKEPLASMWWTMVLTGMGPREYWGAWEIEGETVKIHGEKTAGRDRIIPKLGDLVRPTLPYKPLRKAIRTASKRKVQPYDARRTFARLLSEADVWPVHRAVYMGHGQKTLTDYYAAPRVAQKMLDDDRAKVVSYLKSESRKRVNPLAAKFFQMEGET